MNRRTPPSPRHPRPSSTPQAGSPRSVSRKGAALHIAAVLIAAGAVTWMGITSVMPGWPRSATVASAKKLKYRGPSTPIEIDAALAELGLTPKVLCAANLSAQQASVFASAAATSMRSHIADYRAAMDAVGQARGTFNNLLRQVQGGAATPETIAALDTAQTTLNTTIAQRQAVLDTVLADAIDDIPAPAATLLNTVRANHRAWDINEIYLGDARSEHDWVALRDALANDRINASLNIDPDPNCHQLLLTAQAQTNASNALANLPNLPDIKAAWDAAMGY